MKSKSAKKTEKGALVQEKEAEAHQTQRSSLNSLKVLTGKISSEYRPLMAQNWAADMRLYIKTCSNLEILSTEEQRTLCKKLVNLALWSQVEFLRGDNMEVMVMRVEEAFNSLQPVFGVDVPKR